MPIHPTAIIDPKAKILGEVEIGPYCVVGADVTLGEGSVLQHHVSLSGPSIIGKGNIFYPFTSIGAKTQDLKYKGEPTYLEIGDYNEFREFATVNRGTGIGEKTIVGSNNHFLAYAHIAHNCVVGNHCIFSNNGTIGGHVLVEDHVVIGGLAAVHQFCRIGQHAIIGGCTKVVQDVPPYFIADGNPAEIRGVNTVGLQRRGFTDEQLRCIRAAYKVIYDDKLNTSQAVSQLKSKESIASEEQILIDFIEKTERGIIR